MAIRSVSQAQIREEAPCCDVAPKMRRKDLKTFASLFKVMGDETRLEILSMLAAAGGALCVCHIEGQIKDLSQPTISHHLRLLREEGLVTSERRGTWVYYSLAPTLVERLRKAVDRLG